jgi:hypothetical protein
MKNKQQLLQEQKQLRIKLAQVTKQINLQEVARMQQIAGINEIKKIVNLYSIGDNKFEDDAGYQFEEEDGKILLYAGDGEYNKEFKKYVRSLGIKSIDFEEREYDGDIYTFDKSSFNIID